MNKERLTGEDFERLIFDPEIDNCPLCDTPIKTSYFSWNLFHGEASLSCCGAVFQIKSWGVDKKEFPEVKKFSDSLNDPHRIYFKIDTEWIDPIRQAMKITGKKKIQEAEVFNMAKEILDKSKKEAAQ